MIGRHHDRHARRTHITAPEELVSLRGKGIVDIVSSGWGFHALDRHGHVWLWGRVKYPFLFCPFIYSITFFFG